MILRYLPGQSRLSALDARLMLGVYLVGSLSVFQGSWKSLAVQAGLCGLLLVFSGLSLAQFLRGLGGLLVLVIFLTTVSLAELLLPGVASDSERVLGILANASTLGLRLLLSLFLVFLLAASHPVSALRDVLDWAIRPFSTRLAADFSLAAMVMLAGFPLLLNAGRRTQDSLRSKGLRFRRHPLMVLRISAVHMLSTGAAWAKHLSTALAARGYGIRIPDNPRTGFWSPDCPIGTRVAQALGSVLTAVAFSLPVVFG